jgi:hypothetical protein
MFSGLNYTTGLLRELPDIWISQELQMVSGYLKLICAIFDSSRIHTSMSLRGSLLLLPDRENRIIAIGMSLLSCIEAELHDMLFPLTVNGRHLRFSTYTYVGHYCH